MRVARTGPGDQDQRGGRLYLHVFAWPFGHLHLPGLAGLRCRSRPGTWARGWAAV